MSFIGYRPNEKLAAKYSAYRRKQKEQLHKKAEQGDKESIEKIEKQAARNKERREFSKMRDSHKLAELRKKRKIMELQNEIHLKEFVPETLVMHSYYTERGPGMVLSSSLKKGFFSLSYNTGFTPPLSEDDIEYFVSVEIYWQVSQKRELVSARYLKVMHEKV